MIYGVNKFKADINIYFSAQEFRIKEDVYVINNVSE